MSERFFGLQQPEGKGCWVMLRRYYGQLLPSGTHCECPPRPGMLTCRYHAKYEERAQLKAAAIAKRAQS